jgi:hypothetical protein
MIPETEYHGTPQTCSVGQRTLRLGQRTVPSQCPAAPSAGRQQLCALLCPLARPQGGSAVLGTTDNQSLRTPRFAPAHVTIPRHDPPLPIVANLPSTSLVL